MSINRSRNSLFSIDGPSNTMVDLAANQDKDVTDAASDAARSMAADAMLVLNLGPKKDTRLKKRGSGSNIGPAKIKSIYVCTDTIGLVLALV